MFCRREFLRAGTLVALAPTVPGFLACTARAATPERDGRILVVVQLDGGNDGINTVVPFKDDGYAKSRKALRLPTDALHKVTQEIGLHPAMSGVAKLLEDGRLAIVQGVGYPNPSRSHFRSMAIWHSANLDLRGGEDSERNPIKEGFGWIGQGLDAGQRPADGVPGAVFVGDGTLPLALAGRRSVTAVVTRPEESVLTRNESAGLAAPESGNGQDLAAFVRRSTLDAYATSERMRSVLRSEDTAARYPSTGLADRLRIIARLIKAGGGTRIFYTAQRSYDTHSLQLPLHANLLGELSSALKAFLDDLATAKLAERVAVLCFSEFGRRVCENGSQGTDHGSAGPVFLAGPKVKAGLIGEAPKLQDLQDGDLKIGIDFRRIYAGLLEDWLELPSKPSLGGNVDKLALFRNYTSSGQQ